MIELTLRYDTWADWRARREAHYRSRKRYVRPYGPFFMADDAFDSPWPVRWVLGRTGCL